jgi:hypothetical protein
MYKTLAKIIKVVERIIVITFYIGLAFWVLSMLFKVITISLS